MCAFFPLNSHSLLESTQKTNSLMYENVKVIYFLFNIIKQLSKINSKLNQLLMLINFLLQIV